MTRAVSAVTPSTGFISRLTDNFVIQTISAVAKAVFGIFKAMGNFLTGKSFKPVAQITPRPTTESTATQTPEASPSTKPKINWVELARQAAEKVKNDQASGSLPRSGDPEVSV